MDIEFNSQLVQSQRTVITQKLIEHLEILQMPSFDSSRHIDEMLDTNPLLECGIPEYCQNLEELLENNREKYSHKYSCISSQSSQDGDDFLSYTKASVTLREYLKLQLVELKIQPGHKKITDYLIENLDTDGYLREDINDFSNALEVSERNVKYSLKILQSLEPAGVGTRDIKECLLLQLKRKEASITRESFEVG